MSVISRPTVRIKTFDKPNQFFDIGEEFFYTPMTNTNLRLILKTVDNSYSYPRCVDCALHKRDLCGHKANSEGGLFYIPDCDAFTRRDDKEVIFEEVCICQ